MIQTFELFPGMTLRCFPDTRFKQNILTLQLVRPMSREENGLNSLIPAVLMRGCRRCPDLRSITLQLDDLYGAAAGVIVRRVGNWLTTGLSCSCIADRYALEGDRVLAPMLRFLMELLLDPVLENGHFRSDYVESEKRNLIQTIEAQRNDKRSYATAQLTRLMSPNDPFGIPRLGETDLISAITAESAYDHYRKLLRESPMELFYVGPAQPEQVAQLLKPLLAQIPRQVITLPSQTGFSEPPAGDHTEQLDVTQSRLCMGFVTPHTCRDRDFVHTQLFNMIFGAGMTCKLFMHIREKLSLCYDIGSGYHSHKGIITLSAGIDSGKEAQVRREILAQLELCRQGQITEQELEAAKQAMRSQLQAFHDSPDAIESYYATTALSGMCLTPSEYRQAVEDTTLEQVVQAARQLQLHTTYFLKGVQE